MGKMFCCPLSVGGKPWLSWQCTWVLAVAVEWKSIKSGACRMLRFGGPPRATGGCCSLPECPLNVICFVMVVSMVPSAYLCSMDVLRSLIMYWGCTGMFGVLCPTKCPMAPGGFGEKARKPGEGLDPIKATKEFGEERIKEPKSARSERGETDSGRFLDVKQVVDWYPAETSPRYGDKGNMPGDILQSSMSGKVLVQSGGRANFLPQWL